MKLEKNISLTQSFMERVFLVAASGRLQAKWLLWWKSPQSGVPFCRTCLCKELCWCSANICVCPKTLVLRHTHALKYIHCTHTQKHVFARGQEHTDDLACLCLKTCTHTRARPLKTHSFYSRSVSLPDDEECCWESWPIQVILQMIYCPTTSPPLCNYPSTHTCTHI